MAQEPKGMELSLERALEMALAPEGSARLALAREAYEQAQARERQARGYLLPTVEGSYTLTNFTRNLQAFGVSANLPIPGVGVPTFVGPITNSDLRAQAAQTVFDLSAILRYRGAKNASQASRHELEAARNQAQAAVAKAYMAAQRAEQARRTGEANVELARRTLRLARTQKAAGTGTGIEETRAEVLLANEQQRLTQAKEDEISQRMQLLRAMGVPLGTMVTLTTEMKYAPAELPEAEGAIRAATEQRPEWKAQLEREQVAERNFAATKWERLPAVSAFGDYGNIGLEVGSGRATRTVGVQVRVPVFDGGKRDARRDESASMRRAEAIRSRDTRAQMELEVRLSIEALRSAEEQMRAALVARTQAEKELAQAERRFEAGVAPGFEVTDAQTRLARARESAVNALFKQRAARIDYGLATGAVEPALQ
jgi:outer membrane protein TolC